MFNSRVMIMILLGAVLSLYCVDISASRHIELIESSEGNCLQVSILLSLNDGCEMPPALIIEENLPNEFILTEAIWEGRTFSPVKINNCLKWLFGYGSGNPPTGEGTLMYRLLMPSFSGRSAYKAVGRIYDRNGAADISGDNVLPFNDTAPEASYELTIQEGWQLLSLPLELDGASRQALASAGDSVYQLNDARIPVKTAVARLSAGEPFWFYRAPGFGTAVLPLTGKFSTEGRENSFGRDGRVGWRLTGVNALEAVPSPDEGAAWKWSKSVYTEYSDEEFQPGHAYWLK